MKDTWKDEQLVEFAKKYGKGEFRLLILFKVIKSKAQEELEKSNFEVDEEILNEVSVRKANEILLSEEDVTIKDIEMLLQKIRTKTVEKYKKQLEKKK